ALIVCRDDLLQLNALHGRELVAQLRRTFEIEAACGLLHAYLQLRGDLFVAAFQHLHGRIDVLRVRFASNQAHTRRRAPPDLMLQARPAAIGEKAVAAIADPEQLLQLVERIPHSAGVGERPEVAPGRTTRPAVESEPRELMVDTQVN